MMVASPATSPTIGGIVVRPSEDAMVTLRCTTPRKRGGACGHIVIRMPLAIWEQALADEIEPQCASCGTVYKLKEWR